MTKMTAFAGFTLICLLFSGCAVSRQESPASRARAQAVVAETVSATLIWEAPTSNTDGSPLKDLAGYKIYCGTSPEKLEKLKWISVSSEELLCRKTAKGKHKKKNGMECTYTVRGLDPSIRYFAVTAVNSAGKESDFSNQVKK